MNYNYVFSLGKLKSDALEEFGFKAVDSENYAFTTDISRGDFKAAFSLSPKTQTLSVDLFDNATGEKYFLFDMKNVHNAFVETLRTEVEAIIERIKEKCFETKDIKNEYIAYLKSQFSAEPDFPWEKLPEAFVFRCKNKKWFALVMKIKYKQLGLLSDEDVWIVNIKAKSDEIENLVDNTSIFNAWHMNKKHWITILLTAITDFEKLCRLTQTSFELVSR